MCGRGSSRLQRKLDQNKGRDWGEGHNVKRIRLLGVQHQPGVGDWA